MPIPMEAPAAFLAKLSTGELVRYGAIIKDSSTGRIVGHLKETGQLGEVLSQLALSPLDVFKAVNPVSVVADVAGVGIGALNAIQLRDIKLVLEQLQLTTNVAALASVAGLGVSIGSFAALNAKLTAIEGRLDSIADDVAAIKASLHEMKLSWEAMSLARIEAAAQSLITAEKASEEGRRLELAKEAASRFSELKQYYRNVLKRDGLFVDLALEVEQLQELIARYTLCCVGLLHAEFIIGDVGAYRSRLDDISAEYASLVQFSPRATYIARTDQLEPLALGADFESLGQSLMKLRDYADESVARVESFGVELSYIERNDLTFSAYREALESMDSGLVLLPASETATGQT